MAGAKLIRSVQLWPEHIGQLEKLQAEKQVSFNAALRMAVEAGLKAMASREAEGSLSDVLKRLDEHESRLAALESRKPR